VGHIGVHRLLFGAGLGQLLASAVAAWLFRADREAAPTAFPEPEHA
jgi:hypothetical protein